MRAGWYENEVRIGCGKALSSCWRGTADLPENWWGGILMVILDDHGAVTVNFAVAPDQGFSNRPISGDIFGFYH